MKGKNKMKYENAKRGLQMIYTAEIFEMIAFLLTVAAGVAALKLSAAALAAGLIALVLVIVAAIKQFKGLVIARNDEVHYKQALIVLVVWFAASMLSYVLPMIFPTLESTVSHSLGSNLLNTLVLVTVVQATNALLKNKENSALVKKGNIVIGINIAAFWLENLLSAFAAADELRVGLIVILGLVYVVVFLIGYFKYLSYLKNAADEI